LTGVAIVFVTGMSGVGKSTVLAELARRGEAVVDTDHGGYIEPVFLVGQDEPEPWWREDRMHALLDAHTASHLFIAGTVANQGRFYARFDAVVLLSAPLEVLLQRIASRSNNDFGKSSRERDRIIRDVTSVEPLLRKQATLEVDTRRPLDEVVEVVLSTASGSSEEDNRGARGSLRGPRRDTRA